MNYEKLLCLFYTKVSGIEVNAVEEIPADSLRFLCAIEPAELAKPLIAEAIREGRGESKICIWLQTDRSVVRRVKKRYWPKRTI